MPERLKETGKEVEGGEEGEEEEKEEDGEEEEKEAGVEVSCL